MSTLKIMVAAAGGIALVSCAPMQTKVPATYVSPVQTVRHGSDAETLYRAGRMFQDRGRYDDALAAYKQALAQDSKFVEARNGIAVVYALKGDAERAENELRIAIDMAPDAAHLRNNLGYLLAQQGRADEAREELARAKGLAPADIVVANNLAAVTAPSAIAMAEPARVPHEPLPAAQPAPQAQPLPTAQPLPPAQWSPPAQVQSSPEPVAIAAPAAATQPATEMHRESFQPATFRGYRIEVSNGNGTEGLARRTSYLLGSLEFDHARLTNDKPFGRVQSSVEYVAGAEDAAREVSAHLPNTPPLAQVAKLERNAKVRVLLGRDFPARDPAIAQAKPPKPRG